MRPGDLALPHRDAAGQLRQIFAEPDREDQPLRFAEFTGIVEAYGPTAQLAQRRDIGRHPGKAVRGDLLFVETAGIDRAVAHHPAGKIATRPRQQRLGRIERGGGGGQKLHRRRSKSGAIIARC